MWDSCIKAADRSCGICYVLVDCRNADDKTQTMRTTDASQGEAGYKGWLIDLNPLTFPNAPGASCDKPLHILLATVVCLL